MYDRILVPHAGTAGGDEALRHAIEIAKRFSSQIYILHIIEQVHSPPTWSLAESERNVLLERIKNVNDSIKEEAEKMIEKKALQCKENNIETAIKVDIGDAAEMILDMIENEKIDLVIMAKRRKLKGVKKLLSLGSVSRKIVENVTCPVVLLDIENL
ncbi:universal stress protein [Nitrosopumilus sp. K4]|uniref:universal stress protein n=1 Tax=Nitrosopumilus sp. K4 TaxID=2795383 RepID=UPI001BAD0952|nr:universal stress protein [Nitrosopumilus sp. K4]QUC64176.1 universal stress protein [Nitrosopumilus sp. K4]